MCIHMPTVNTFRGLPNSDLSTRDHETKVESDKTQYGQQNTHTSSRAQRLKIIITLEATSRRD